MRRALAFALLLGCVGCIEELADQKAVGPLFAETDRIALPGLAGRWASEGDEPFGFTLGESDGDYVLTPTREEGAGRPIAVRLGRVAGTLYWDATALPGEDRESLREQHLLPLHSIARVRLEGDCLVVTPLRSDWVKSALADGSLETPHVEIEGEPLLTGSTAELQQLLLTHGGDEGAFAEEEAPCGEPWHTASSGVLVLHRLPDDPFAGL